MMTYIDTIKIEDAEGIVKQEYDKGIRRSGRVFNILKIMSRSPDTLKISMRMYLTIIGYSCIANQSMPLLNRIPRG